MNESKSRIETLDKEGWERRFIASEPRLSEAIEAYEEAGFEVHLEPLPENREPEKDAEDTGGDECRICFEGFQDQYRIIFTRPRKAVNDAEKLLTILQIDR